MKLAVIGGGSTYTPELLSGLIEAPLPNLEVCLYDPDLTRVEPILGFCLRMARRVESPIKISAASSLEETLVNANFVVTQLRVGGQEARHADILMGLKYDLVGQETTGVGGMAKALRTIPVLLEIAAAMERHCPDAWLINFTNPSGLVTEALRRFGRERVLGLCNVPIEVHMELSDYFKRPQEDIELDWVGLNHLGWVRHVKIDGVDRMDEVIEQVEEGALDHLPEVEYPRGLVRALGMLPSCYLRYFYAPEKIIAELKASPQTRAEQVQEIDAALFERYRDPTCDTLPELLKQRGGAWYSRLAIQVLHALNSDEPSVHIVNVPNGETFSDLPPDATVEVACEISKAGVRPLPTRPLEDSIVGLIRQVKSYERLTIEAALERSRDTALLALMANPLIPHAQTANALLKDLIDRDHI